MSAPAAIRLRSSDFRREREAQWIELESLVDQVERRGLKALDAEDLRRLPSLYRAAVSGLSVARAISLDRNLLAYLESLVARAWFCVYGVKPRTDGAVRRFFARSFPAAVRRHAVGVWLAIGLLLAGAVCGLAIYDPDTYAIVMPADIADGRSPTSSTADLRDILYSGGDRSDEDLGLFATFLFTHNARIGMLSFALGFALGIPAVLLLFYNGLLIGTLAGLYASRGMAFEFWAWVLPHGITELLAVALCGGAGLAVAGAIIAPGRFGRLHALARTGREAALIVLGAALLFLIAGFIEGVLRQVIHDVAIRYVTAAVTALLWATWFGFGGTRADDERPEAVR
jgi:uncharacterized membrane protein SpoIIM required for sporulation